MEPFYAKIAIVFPILSGGFFLSRWGIGTNVFMRKFNLRFLSKISKRIRKLVEHKRFQFRFSGFFVLLIVLVALFPKSSHVFGQGNVIATEEIILTTKKTSRLPVLGMLSQGFSYYHPGVDIQKTFGDPVYPMLAGVVSEAGFQFGGYGNYVLLDHQNGYFSLYAHMNKILVKKDEEVSQETVLGTIGVTGYSTGPHLHFEVYENGIATNPLSILPEVPSSTGSVSLYTGGPSTLPSHPLVLPIAQQAVLEQPVASQPVEKEKEQKPTFGIWLPNDLKVKKQELAPELPKLPL